MRKILLGFVLFTACNNDTARVSQLQAELKECRAQAASVQPVPVAAVQFSTVTVDYSQSWSGVEQEFGDVNSNINDEHFPSEPGGTAQIALTPRNLHRDGEDSISTEEAERRLAVQEFRPATARELRAFAKANPDYQRQFPTVALGSSWVRPGGGRRVLYLGGWSGRRGLGLYWADDGWDSSWRFLAARK